MGKAVKAVAAVAVGVAVGFATGNPYLGVLAGGAMFASGSLTPKVDMGTATQTELKQVIRSSKEPAHFQFGACAVGGLLAWAQEEAGTQSEKEWLHLVYVLSEGEIEALSELYLNQEPASAAGDRVRYALIRNPSAADAYLLANSPDWRDTQIGTGLSYVRLSIRYDRDYWASGIPTPLFVLQGCREIYDPRSGTTGYSDNAALVILWYLRTRLRVPDDEIIWEMFIDGANIADERVAVPGGGTERRYRIGGGFKADARKGRVLADMEAACAGRVVRIGGRFGLQVGAYYGPYELTIDEDMVIGAVTGQTEVSQADAVNTMTGKFIDPEQRWTETDYPAVSVVEWVEQDDGPIEDTLDLQLVYSPYQAQRLANIALRRKRNGGGLSMPLNFRGYACRPGRVVRVYLPSLNIDGEFRVTDWDFHGDNGCKVTLSPEDPEIYDDAVGQPYNPLGFISLPTGGIAAPAGLTYTLEAIGETVQGRLDWSAVSGALTYSVVIKSGGASVQAVEVPSSSTTCTVGGLPAGQYVAEVRTRGDFGQSGAATVSFSVNAPPMPDSIIVQVTNSEVTLIPQLAWSGTPVSFRFYYSPTLLDINAVRGSAQLLSTGASLVHAGRAYGTTYHYWVESVNAYGHSDLLYQEVQTTSDFTELWDQIEKQTNRPGGLKDYFDNRADANAAAIEAAKQAQEVFDATLKQAETRIETANGDIQALRNQIGDLDPEAQGARIAELEQKTEELDALQAMRYLALQARNAGASALIDVVQKTQVDDKQALTQLITQQTSRLDAAQAQLIQIDTTVANLESATTERLDQQQSSIGSAVAQLLELNQTVSALDETTTRQLEQAQSSIDGNLAQLQELSQTLANEQEAATFRKTALQAQALGNTAQQDIDRVLSADERSALSQRIETLRASVDGQVAQISEELLAVVDPATGVVARYAVIAEVNGKRALIGLQVDGETAEFMAIADRFVVINPVSGEPVTAFVVQGGRVVIPEALIGTVKFSKLVSETGEVLIENGKIKAKFLTVDNARSPNYQAGTAGWSINADGSAELNNAVIRGRLEGATGTFAGTLSAQSVNAVDSVNIRDGAVSVSSSKVYPDEKSMPHGNNGTNSWGTVISDSIDPAGKSVSVKTAFMYHLLASSSSYARASMLLRITVSGQEVYRWARVYGRIFDYRAYGDGNGATVDVTEYAHLPMVISGWNGNRTVAIEASGDFNAGDFNTSRDFTVSERFIELTTLKK